MDTLPLSRKFLLAGLGTLGMSAAAGLAFAGWIAHGDDIFVSLAASGLGWCF